MLLKIALNGVRTKKENQYVPHSLDEIEKEVSSIYRFGYKVFHIHCYDEKGKESLRPSDVSNLIARVKRISPDIQIGISSGEWIEPNITKRIGYLNSWKELPDFVSVNMIEESAIEISKILISKGISIEAGLNEKKAAEIFVESKLEDYCCRILIEPEEENLSSAINTVTNIENILNANGSKLKRLLHGFNSVSWDLLFEAKRRGYDSRIGMEDTLFLQNGKKVKSNLEIIEQAKKILSE